MAPIPALTTSVGCFQCSLVFFINIMIRYFDFHGLRVLLGLSALIVALLAGCTGKSETSKKNQEETTPSAETKSPKSKSPKSKITQRKLTHKKSTKIVSKAFSSSDKKNSFSTSRGFSSGSRKEVQLGRAFWEFALESQSNGATLVVWLIDRSSSAEKLMHDIGMNDGHRNSTFEGDVKWDFYRSIFETERPDRARSLAPCTPCV